MLLLEGQYFWKVCELKSRSAVDSIICKVSGRASTFSTFKICKTSSNHQHITNPCTRILTVIAPCVEFIWEDQAHTYIAASLLCCLSWIFIKPEALRGSSYSAIAVGKHAEDQQKQVFCHLSTPCLCHQPSSCLLELLALFYPFIQVHYQYFIKAPQAGVLKAACRWKIWRGFAFRILNKHLHCLCCPVLPHRVWEDQMLA